MARKKSPVTTIPVADVVIVGLDGQRPEPTLDEIEKAATGVLAVTNLEKAGLVGRQRAAARRALEADHNVGDDLCDRCMRSGVVVSRVKNDKTVCVDCDVEAFTSALSSNARTDILHAMGGNLSALRRVENELTVGVFPLHSSADNAQKTRRSLIAAMRNQLDLLARDL